MVFGFLSTGGLEMRVITVALLIPAVLIGARQAVSGQQPRSATATEVPGAIEGIAVGYAGHYACQHFEAAARGLAVAVSDLESAEARRLIEAGADVNARATAQHVHGMTLLQTAVVYEWGVDAIGLLLDAGAAVNAQDQRGHTALTLACSNPCGADPAVIAQLARAGAAVDGPGPGGMTPLMYAALYDPRGTLVAALLDASADVKAQDKRGWTALMHATRRRRDPLVVVQRLVAAGTPIDARNAAGGTALSNAAFQGHVPTVQFLILSGADVNAQDRAKWTPLLCSSMNGHAQVAKLLIEAGANVNETDQLGRTALQLARDKGATAVVQLLVARGSAEVKQIHPESIPMSICVVAGSNCGHGGWHVGLLTLTLVAGWLGLSSQAGAQEPEVPPAKPPFTEGIYCGACHSNAERAQAMRDVQGREIAPYDLWCASAMANAARDPYWCAVVSVEAAATPRRKHDIEKLCSRCHAPMAESVPLSPDGVVLDYLNQADPQAFLAADGVSCAVCHQITDQALGKPESYTGRYEISPRRVAWGPHANPVADSMQNHAGYLAAEGPHIMQSALCGTCHTLITETLDPDGTPTGHELHEQSAYLEWRNSIYNNEVDVDNPTARTCQDCHVPTTDQDGAVIRTRLARTLAGTDLAEAVPRAPYGRHSFVGGNVLLAKLLRDNAQELQVFASPQALEATIAATRQMLAHQTAKLTLGKVRHQDGRWQIPVQIENLAGHKFPTGFPSRRAWVRLRVRDAQGAVLFQSGGFDATGRLVDAQGQVLPSEVAGQPGQRHYDRIDSAQQVQIYESVMADKQGEMTFTLLRGARFWKDNRLLPKGWQSDASRWGGHRPGWHWLGSGFSCRRGRHLVRSPRSGDGPSDDRSGIVLPEHRDPARPRGVHRGHTRSPCLSGHV